MNGTWIYTGCNAVNTANGKNNISKGSSAGMFGKIPMQEVYIEKNSGSYKIIINFFF